MDLRVLLLVAAAALLSACGEADRPSSTPTVQARAASTPVKATPTPVWDLSSVLSLSCDEVDEFQRMAHDHKLALWNALVTAQDLAVIRQEETGEIPDYEAFDQAVALRFGVSTETAECVSLQGQRRMVALPRLA